MAAAAALLLLLLLLPARPAEAPPFRPSSFVRCALWGRGGSSFAICSGGGGGGFRTLWAARASRAYAAFLSALRECRNERPAPRGAAALSSILHQKRGRREGKQPAHAYATRLSVLRECQTEWPKLARPERIRAANPRELPRNALPPGTTSPPISDGDRKLPPLRKGGQSHTSYEKKPRVYASLPFRDPIGSRCP
ncbi:Hypothetical predicted protein [Podarcis lilfordi]|uniref:Uncharacterized protein n=1 Tax=Podarcis lilfordi TaxID=74358 RepID=A0AA35PT07_9SAUR|nr:Hypothetical predicted protein [Podarcis lilfordi]